MAPLVYTGGAFYMEDIMKTIVHIIESERGWGSKVDEVKEFDTREEAVLFCREYNAGNNMPQVPDWYMYATIAGQR